MLLGICISRRRTAITAGKGTIKAGENFLMTPPHLPPSYPLTNVKGLGICNKS